MEYTVVLTSAQKRDIIEALNAKIGDTLKLQKSTDDLALVDLLDVRLNQLRGAYAAVQNATENA